MTELANSKQPTWIELPEGKAESSNKQSFLDFVVSDFSDGWLVFVESCKNPALAAKILHFMAEKAIADAQSHLNNQKSGFPEPPYSITETSDPR